MIEFSVIVPVYNVEKYLERCVLSITSQHYENIEVILIDDGSTDHSGVICDKIGKINSCIKVIHKKNEGLGLTRNIGIDVAVGKYILFVDSDDYIDINTFDKLHSILTTDKAEICFFGFNKVKKDGSILKIEEKFPGKNTFDRMHLISMCLGEPLKKDLYEIGPAWKAVYNKEFLDKYSLRFLSERLVLSEDYIFSAAACSKATQISFCDAALYYYCDNNTSLTNSYREDRPAKAVSLYKLMKEITVREQLDEKALDRVYNNFLINLLVSFKHICLNKKMNSFEKLKEIKKICNDEDIIQVIKDRNFSDTIQLKILRYCINNKKYRLIKYMISLRYGCRYT